MLNPFLNVFLNYMNPLRNLNILYKNSIYNNVDINFSSSFTGNLFFTCDLELTPLLMRGLSKQKSKIEIEHGLKYILNMLDKYKICATFFTEGYLCKNFPDLVCSIDTNIHEIGCHGYDHSIYGDFWFPNKLYNFKNLSLQQRKEHINKTNILIKGITGYEPLSFRAPFLAIDEKTLNLLEKEGFLIDSSLYNVCFGKISNPYHPDNKNILKNGNMKIYEFPITMSINFYKKNLMQLYYKPIITEPLNIVYKTFFIMNKLNHYQGINIVLLIHLWEYVIYNNKIQKLKNNIKKLGDLFFFIKKNQIKSKTMKSKFEGN
jgi:hypothetical protein